MSLPLTRIHANKNSDVMWHGSYWKSGIFAGRPFGFGFAFNPAEGADSRIVGPMEAVQGLQTVGLNRVERWQSGLTRTPGKREYSKGIGGSNPPLSAIQKNVNRIRVK
jgi:hypothetical protein